MSTAWVPSLEICLIGVACKKCMIQNIYLYSTEADDASLCRWWGRALNGCCLFKNVCVAQSLGAACRRRGFFHEFVMKCWLTNRKIKKKSWILKAFYFMSWHIKYVGTKSLQLFMCTYYRHLTCVLQRQKVTLCYLEASQTHITQRGRCRAYGITSKHAPGCIHQQLHALSEWKCIKLW